MRFGIITASLLVLLCGCQTPRTSYTNGLIVWCSTSAVGIGWGEYVEVPAGGTLERITTNQCAAVWGESDTISISRLYIDNSIITNAINHVE
jgi:hypothetical protein